MLSRITLFIICILICSNNLFAQELPFIKVEGNCITLSRFFETDSTTADSVYKNAKNKKYYLLSKISGMKFQIYFFEGYPVLKVEELDDETDEYIVEYKFFSEESIDTTDIYVLLSDNKQIASTDKISYSYTKLEIDIKPSFEKDEPQKIDASWESCLMKTGEMFEALGYINLIAKGNFSTKPDLNSLNSIRLGAEYSLVWGGTSKFKYVGVSGRIGTEHPQDFSKTNAVGDFIVTTILPYSDIFTRLITGNYTDAVLGIIIEPEIQFVRNTNFRDSNYVRYSIASQWDIPILNSQYIHLFGVAYFQEHYRPRTYIELTIEQEISSSLSVVGKWINGELPPLFSKESDFRIGLRFK